MTHRARKTVDRNNVNRSAKIETLENRVVMSADPLGGPMMSTHDFELPNMSQHVEAAPVYDPSADFWHSGFSEERLFTQIEELDQRIEQTLNEAHNLTGQDAVQSKYGFKGSGQTVVVIDTGLAYSHEALGGGYGDGYRVVGGWDFTENDADFYDDGPEGGHGTHVAGIIGAAGNSTHTGVATGVDLVGLRVFDDAGNGYFSWVEQALQWVDQNSDAFDNPITAVNLSLGTEWNSDSVPGWANLEAEFAALEAKGIFISVSAGNSYQNFNANGVSYPAASDHVIPVMSVDNNGQLSYFSQRADYAIAAPGRGITSTVPDYAANDADTIDDDWLSMSGTSMAAPYVAGASVLVREAMEFIGQTGIDQWDIYDHLMATGDSFFDSTSQTTYKRLNLESAIDALIPEDDYGSSIITAHNLGTLDDSSSPLSTPLSILSGVITTLDDVDYFTFTAGVTGKATFTARGQTHQMDASWAGYGGNGWSESNGDAYVMETLAGQTYTVAISSSGGLGYYDLTINVESTFASIEWGAASAQETRTGLAVSGDNWYSITAGQAGYLTAEALPQSGTATVAIYDAQQNLLATADSSGRVDYEASAGQELLIRVTGESSDFNLRLTNALSVSGGVATLTGTSGNDTLEFTAGAANHTLSLNGVSYTITATEATQFNLAGGGGVDTGTINGTSGNETATLRVGSTEVIGAGYTASLAEVSNSSFNSGGGADVSILHGSAGDDLLVTRETVSTLTGEGFSHTVHNSARVFAYAGAGNDHVEMHDSSGNDQYYAYSNKVVMSGAGFYNYAWGFDTTVGYATSGSDAARFYDTAGDETFDAFSTHAVLTGTGFSNRAEGFDQVFAFSSGGNDIAQLRDSAGDDAYRAWSNRAIMNGDGFYNYAQGFARTYGYASSGNDKLTFNDSAGDDSLYSYADKTVLTGTGFYNYASGFDETHTYATTGNDVARMYDSAGNDLYYAYSDKSVLTGAGFYNYAAGFDQTYAFSSSGTDVARMYDSAGDDLYRGYADRSIMNGSGFYNYAAGFAQVYAFSSSGTDTARFYDSAGADLFRSYADRSIMSGSGFYNYSAGFARSEAFATTGSDTAILYDSTGDDETTASAWGASITSDTRYSEAHGFDTVTANSSNGGTDNATVESALDYAFALEGSWA